MISMISMLIGTSIASPMILHLRADTGVALDPAGKVAVWKDLSPRHSDFATTNLGTPRAVFLTRYHDTAEKRVYKTYASDSVLRPRLVQDGIGGRASVVFDGQQVLVNSSALPLDSGFTMFVVAQDSTGNGHSAVLVDKGPGDFNSDLPNGWADSIDGCFNIGLAWVRDFAKSDFETSAPTLYESSWNGKIGSLWANGGFLASGSGSNPSQRNQSTWIGGVVNPHGDLQNFLVGRISEIRIYAGSLPAEQRETIEDSLMVRYGIETAAPRKRDRRILHLRADTGLVLDASNRLATWKDLSPRHTDFVTPNLGKPQLLFLTPFEDIREKRRYATIAADSLLRPHPERRCIVGSGSCVRFDGANTLVDTTGLPLDSGFTLFVVAQDSSGKGAFTALVDKGPGDLNTDLWTGVDGNFQMGIGWVDNIAQTQFETANPTLYGSSYDSGRGRIWVNGRLEGSGTTLAKPVRNKSTWLGATYNQYPVLMGFLTGRIYEVRIYSGVLDSSERKTIENELVQRYEITSDSLTSGHRETREPRRPIRFDRQGILEIPGVDEGSATLVGLDGRTIATCGIRDGQARLPRFRGPALLAIKSAGFSNTELVLSP